MSRLKSMVGIPAGRRTKWLVLVFWVVVVAVAGPLSGKLTGAEKNDAQSWLPPKAESTQVLALRSHFVSPNVYPAVVVYDRPESSQSLPEEQLQEWGLNLEEALQIGQHMVTPQATKMLAECP